MTTMKSLSNHNVDHPASNISLVISFYHECVNNTHRDLYKILTCETRELLGLELRMNTRKKNIMRLACECELMIDHRAAGDGDGNRLGAKNRPRMGLTYARG